MSDETTAPKDIIQIARDNVGWWNFLLVFVGLIFKPVRDRLRKWWNASKIAREESIAAMQSIAKSLETLANDFRVKAKRDDEIIATIRDGFRALLDGHKVNARMAELALESSPTPMWRCDPKGDAEWVNLACANYFGLPVKEMLGSGWQARIHPEHRERVRDALNRTVMYHEPYNVEYAVRAERGWKNSSASGKPIMSEDNKLLGILGTVEPVDVTTDPLTSAAA